MMYYNTEPDSALAKFSDVKGISHLFLLLQLLRQPLRLLLQARHLCLCFSCPLCALLHTSPAQTWGNTQTIYT